MLKFIVSIIALIILACPNIYSQGPCDPTIDGCFNPQWVNRYTYVDIRPFPSMAPCVVKVNFSVLLCDGTNVCAVQVHDIETLPRALSCENCTNLRDLLYPGASSSAQGVLAAVRAQLLAYFWPLVSECVQDGDKRIRIYTPRCWRYEFVGGDGGSTGGGGAQNAVDRIVSCNSSCCYTEYLVTSWGPNGPVFTTGGTFPIGPSCPVYGPDPEDGCYDSCLQ
jgi:hypothetical protein